MVCLKTHPMEKKNNYEDEISVLIHDRIKAIRLKDIETLMLYYMRDILSYDVVGTLQYVGSAAIRKRMEEWFGSFDGSIGYDIEDVKISASDDLAYSFGLCHVSATKAAGGKLDMWWRETACYRKIDSKWLIIHEHSSVPFDPKSGKASLGITP